MGCDSVLTDSCIWVYLISWLVINSSAVVTLVEAGSTGTWLPRGVHARKQTLKAILRHWCFWIQDLWRRSRIPVISGPPSLSLSPPPPMPRYLRIYVAVAAFALLAAAHYTLHPFHRKEHAPPGAGVFDGEDGQRADSAGVVVDRKGLVSYSPGHAGHPVEMLIERGKKLAEDMERRIASVMSVKDSAKDYVLSFGMRPPRGFDAWYVAAHSSLSFLFTCR